MNANATQERSKLKVQQQLLSEKEQLLNQVEELEMKAGEMTKRLQEIDASLINPDAISVISSPPSAKSNRRGRPPGTGKKAQSTTGGRRGRPPGSKNKAKDAVSAANNGDKSESANNNNEGDLDMSILAEILPEEAAGQTGITTNDLLEKVWKKGIQSKNLGDELIELLQEAKSQELVSFNQSTHGWMITKEGLKAAKDKTADTIKMA